MDAILVSEYIISYCNENNINISNLKLQKLLYFIQATFLINNLDPCFSNRIEAWDFGPVVPDVYRAYKQFGSGPIPMLGTVNKNSIPNVDLIDSVIEQFGKYSASALVEITHRQTPWKQAYQRFMNNIISNESIKEYFN